MNRDLEEMREETVRTSGRGWVIFQAEGTANAKGLRQDIAWDV